MNWRETRARLLPKLRETQQELRGEGPSGQFHPIAERRTLRRKLQRLLLEYAENLPYQSLSRCPICEKPLEVRIDTSGIDGPWWWSECPVEWGVPNACEHFQVFLGAMDFHERVPREVDVWTVLPGPGAPFVIERLIGKEGMQAVVSALALDSGDTGYLISYYSAAPVPQAELHQEWRRETWFIFDDEGNSVEQLVNDPWAFDLGPWLERGKLLWIAPQDPELTLHEGTSCPYRDLHGTQRKQVVVQGRIELHAPPDGSESAYYEPIE